MRIYHNPFHSLYDPSNLRIEGVPFHTNEIPSRSDIILDTLKTSNIGPIAEPIDHGLDPIRAVHTADFIDYLENAFSQSRGPVIPETFATRIVRHQSRHPIGRRGYYCFGTGTPILEGTWLAAYWSAQCALTAADQLNAGEREVYALCRPPGHHAGTDFYGGFCFLNNAAIAARFLKNRVTILDIDYHHGNGTQEIFYCDPQVLYCSLHAHPDEDYPYFWGGVEERGDGPGLGFNYNWPLPQGTNDENYLKVLDVALETIQSFSPSYLIISLGLVIGIGDPAGGFCITTSGFGEIGEHIAQLNVPKLIIQEGGYCLDKLGQNILAFLHPFN
jgi:acetoin utilization deacetylase AcuC-like enzyme